jgi:hypothetical protein
MGVTLAVSLEAIQDVLNDLAIGFTVCRDRENLPQLAGLLRLCRPCTKIHSNRAILVQTEFLNQNSDTKRRWGNASVRERVPAPPPFLSPTPWR